MSKEGYDWYTLQQRVMKWARVHAREDVNYGSPYSYWVRAAHEGICTNDEFNYAAEVYDTLWHYRGD